MKLYEWEIRIKENRGKADVNIKFGIKILSKNFMKLKSDIEQIYQKYDLRSEAEQEYRNGTL